MSRRRTERLLLPDEPHRTLDDYVRAGGGAALAWAQRHGAAAVIDAIDVAGIRGRGGAGFPAAEKWRSIVGSDLSDGDRFAVANGAEGEPGTFKDRLLLRRNPYQVLEGLLVAAHVIDAQEAFVAVKASFEPEADALVRAIDELSHAGWVRIPITLVRGPDEYLFGEEKALLEVIEGEDPLPRQLPPYQYGLFSSSPNLGWSANADRSPAGPAQPAANPTLVNNVETLAAVCAALRIGPDAYLGQGTIGSPGPLLVTVSGDTSRAGVAEVPFGTTLRTVIEEVGGGVLPGRRIRAVLSGVANPVLTEDDLDLPLTYEAFRAAGTGLGAAGFFVYDDRTDMAEVALAVAWFLHVESCGQCSPCKLGTGAIASGLHDLRHGVAFERAAATIARALGTVTDGSRCYLPTQAQKVVTSIIEAFPDDFDAPALRPEVRRHLVPKLADIVDGVVVPDPKQAHKRPDWTYDAQEVSVRS